MSEKTRIELTRLQGGIAIASFVMGALISCVCLFFIKPLGEITSRNGLQVESANAESGHFALLFQFEGDESATRHVIYNCVASRPNLEGATKESAIAPQTESVDITAATIYVAALEPHGDVVKAKADSESSAYADFFTAVTIPTAQ